LLKKSIVYLEITKKSRRNIVERLTSSIAGVNLSANKEASVRRISKKN
jgi:hypothetical protein